MNFFLHGLEGPTGCGASVRTRFRSAATPPGWTLGFGVDTKKSYEEIEVGTMAPGEHTWTAPYRSDWAIAVGPFDE